MFTRGFRYTQLAHGNPDGITLMNMDPGPANTKLWRAAYGECDLEPFEATLTFDLATE